MKRILAFILLAFALFIPACEDDNAVPNPGFSVGTAQQDFYSNCQCLEY
ncbi:MAG TPA: hypothetical protein VGQ39_23625 [Pyrinomonadaceae bacterium]|jgi:hypothetical protein|nr:hypothetical protein [Pyrinomonadaceae bacterium]